MRAIYYIWGVCCEFNLWFMFCLSHWHSTYIQAYIHVYMFNLHTYNAWFSYRYMHYIHANCRITRAKAWYKINTQVLKLTPAHFRWVLICPVPHRPRHWNCNFGAVFVAWNERVGQQLEILPQSERREIDPSIGHDNISASVRYTRFPVHPVYQKSTQQICAYTCLIFNQVTWGHPSLSTQVL